MYGLIVNRLALQPESAEPARRQLDLLRRNWEEKRSRRLEEEDGGGGNGAGGRRGWRRFTTTYRPTINVARGTSALHNNQLRRWK